MPLFKRRAKKENTKKTQKNKGSEEIKGQYEGRLAVDVYETDEEFVVIAPISNMKEENLDIYIEKETITIGGTRELPEEEKGVEKFLHKECYWGKFFRQIILPEEVDSYTSRASFKDGIIKVNLPKMRVSQRKKVKINEAE